MDLTVNYEKVSTQADAFNAVKGQITPELVAKFNVKADFTYNEPSMIVAKGKGFELIMNFNETTATVDLKLGMLLKAFKGKVLESVDKQMRRVL